MESAELLIDTSIVIEHLRKSDKSRSILFNIPENVSLFVSSVTLFELQAGATDQTKHKDITRVLKGIAVLPFDAASAVEAGNIFQKLNSSNKRIEIRDLFIAAVAKANALPLLTLNVKHFERVPGLNIASNFMNNI